MFRETLSSNLFEFKLNPNLFTETSIYIKLPVLTKRWSNLEPDIQKILEIVQEGDKSLYSKDFQKITVQFLNATPEGNLYFKTNTNIELREAKEFVLYKKQKNGILELGFELLNSSENIIICKPKSLRSSGEKRQYPRFINTQNTIYAKDFEVAKWLESLYHYLRSDVDNIITELEREYRFIHSHLEIYYLYNTKRVSLVEEFVALAQKPAFVLVENGLESYPGDFTNLGEFYKSKSELELKLELLKQKNISSFILYPIFFRFRNKQIFIGTCYLWETYPNKIPTSDIFLLEEIENKISAKILENQSEVIYEEEEIINFSKGGILFKISNLEIVQAIIARPKFSAKICTRTEENARLEFFAKNIYQIEDSFYVGAEILGTPYSNKNIQTYFQWIEERKI